MMAVISSTSLRPLLLGLLAAWLLSRSAAMRPKDYDYDLDFKPDGFNASALDKQELPRLQPEIKEMALLEEEVGGWTECQAALNDFVGKFLKIKYSPDTDPAALADTELKDWWVDVESVKLALTDDDALSEDDKNTVALVRKALERLVRLNNRFAGSFAGLAQSTTGDDTAKMTATAGDAHVFGKAFMIPKQKTLLKDDEKDMDFEYAYEEGYMVAVYILSQSLDFINGYLEEWLRVKLQEVTDDLTLTPEEHTLREGELDTQHARYLWTLSYLAHEAQIGAKAEEFWRKLFEECLVHSKVELKVVEGSPEERSQIIELNKLALESKTNEYAIRYFGDVNLRPPAPHVQQRFDFDDVIGARNAKLDVIVRKFAEPETLP
mmetsp:Transcript_44574/g.105650  ORF Transcript_44574/g.105650 Transcript_44574/m.105650 type:complete len:379 (-) Transcript_44574:290-1426(-)